MTENLLFDININHIGFGADYYYIAKSILLNYNMHI